MRTQRNSGHLNKREFEALGKVFAAEVECRLPFQSTAMIYTSLRDMGLLEWGHEKLGVITCYGWYLTQHGRHYYCERCAKEAKS